MTLVKQIQTARVISADGTEWEYIRGEEAPENESNVADIYVDTGVQYLKVTLEDGTVIEHSGFPFIFSSTQVEV